MSVFSWHGEPEITELDEDDHPELVGALSPHTMRDVNRALAAAFALP